MEDILVVKQSAWSEPIDESLPWQDFEENEPETFPAEGAQVWVKFANGRSGPANFYAESPGQFSCFNAPFGALVNQKVTGWAYKHWNPSIPQVEGVE